MKYPIPRPKTLEFTGEAIPATFAFASVDPLFAPAVRVFQTYAERLFGAVESAGAILLKQEEGLGDGYRLSIGETVEMVVSTAVGANYALATLLQLAEKTADGVVFPQVAITDAPDSNWRGVMIDLARCYHEVEYLYAVADLCWLYKVNRLQLHLTDDQAVRFPLVSLPKAVSEEHYTREQLTALVDYCRDRGVVLVPEIDAPGHFRAFNAAYPELFGTTTEDKGAETTAQTGIVSGIMRTQEQTFAIMQEVFREVAEVFVDSPWIHIGGDEAQIDQWNGCEASMQYCAANGLSDIHELYGHCVARFSRMILDLGRTPVVWEGFDEKTNAMIPKETVVFSWESYYQIAPSLLKGGFRIINSSWQPLYIVNPVRMWDPETILDWEKNRWEHWWEKSQACEKPIVTDRDPAILGGQICVWGDLMQPTNAYAPRHDMLRDEFGHLARRLPALAEKTWTSYGSPDKEAFMRDTDRLTAVAEKLFHT